MSSPNSMRRASLPNPGKSSRTSLSILKPLKARCPLQDLDQLLNTEEDTTTTTTFTAMRRRRVSFAGVNKVKEFHTAAESLTVHHTPAYDEPFTTTMSSDSSSHHHLTDSKISDSTGFEQTSRFSVGSNVTNAADAVLDLTVKSTHNLSFKPEELHMEAKENMSNNFRPLSQNTCYEADMECTTPHPVVYYNSDHFSFTNKSMEFTSINSGLSDTQHSKSMMEFTEVIHGPVFSNDSVSKQYESMEFTQHVNGQLAVQDTEVFDQDTDTFSQPMPSTDVFKLLSNAQSEAAGQMNSIFGHQNNLADLNDSTDMSFGVTGVISQPLIECLRNADNSEVEETRDEMLANCSSDPISCDGRTEWSNAEGSEMELTEANAFSAPENTKLPVTDSLEAVKKTISDNFKTKPTDHILSFLRKKVSVPPQTNHSSDNETSRNLQEQQANSSNCVNSQSNLSLSKSKTMDFTAALASNIQGNSFVDEFVSETSTELTNAVAQDGEIKLPVKNSSMELTSVMKNSSMELTKTVSNNVKCMDSNVSLPEAHSRSDVIPSYKVDNSCYNDRKSVGGTVFDTINFDASNVITSTQESKTYANTKFEEEDEQIMSKGENVSECSGRKSEKFFDSISFNATNVATSTQKNPGDTTPAVNAHGGGAVATATTSFDEAETATSTARTSQNIPSSSNGRKSLSVESFLSFPRISVDSNFGIQENLASNEVQDLTSNTKDIRSQSPSNEVELHIHDHQQNSVSFQHSPNDQPSGFLNIDEEESAKVGCESFIGSQPMEFTNVHAFGKVNSELCSPNTDNRAMNFTRMCSSNGKAMTGSTSQSTSGNQPVEFPVVNAFEKEGIEVSSQTFAESQAVEFTNTQSQSTSSRCWQESNNVLMGENACSADISSMEFTNACAYQCETNTEPIVHNFSVQEEKSSQVISQDVSKNLSSGNFVSCGKPETNETTLEDQSNRDIGSIITYESEVVKAGLGDNSLIQPLEMISTNTYEAGLIECSKMGDLFDTSTTAKSEKKRQKSRRSELFVPIQKSFSHGDMSPIEEVNNSKSSDCSVVTNGRFTHSMSHVDQTEDRVRGEALTTPKPSNIFKSDFPKAYSDLQGSKFDCGYKINESQMFTKSMLEQTSEHELDITQPEKSNLESEAYDPLNSLFVSNSYESFSHKVVSNNLIASVSAVKDVVIMSPFVVAKNNLPQFSAHKSLETNEETQTFSRLMKSIVEDTAKEATLFKPGNFSMVSTAFDESQFTLPVENIPRSVFLSDEIVCMPLSESSEVKVAGTDTEDCFVSKEDIKVTGIDRCTVLENELSPLEEGRELGDFNSCAVTVRSAECNTSEIVQNHIKTQLPEHDVSDNAMAISSTENQPEQQESRINDEEFLSSAAQYYPLEAEINTHQLCDESFPLADLTINEELMKNITISRTKPRKDLRKSRCLVDLDNSITQQHDKDTKKCKVFHESYNMTGIATLPDLSIISVVSPSPEKTAPVQRAGNDISASEIHVNENRLNHQNISANLEMTVPASIDIMQNIPEVLVSQPSPPAEVDIKLDTEQFKTPRSILKKTCTKSHSKDAAVPNSPKEVLLQKCSGPKKRGFVKNVARLYDNFIATDSPSNARVSNLDQCKRTLDEKYVKSQKPLLQRYLDTTTSNANASILSDFETVDLKPTAKGVVNQSFEYVSFSPGEGFEKSDYTPVASSNSSMICNVNSFEGPSLNSTRSICKSARRIEQSPMTPGKSPARKRQRLPFVSTPVKSGSAMEANLGNTNEGKNDGPQTDTVDANVYSPESSTNSSKCGKFCSDFLERFDAETRPTKMRWKVLEASSILWSFEFLNGQLQLTIHFKPTAPNCLTPVDDIAFFSVKRDAKPKEIIGQNIVLQRYPQDRLRSLCRNSSNVFDVLHMIANDATYAKKVIYSLDGMLTAKFFNECVVFELLSTRPNHIAEVTVDLSSWQSLSSSSISVNNLLGTLRPQKIRSLFEECEKNEDCIRQFYRKCNSYIGSIQFTGPKIW